MDVIKPGPFDPAKLAYRNFMMQMAVFFRRDMLKQTGLLDTKFAYALDWDLWLRTAIAFEKNIAYLPETVACYRTHDQSQSVRDVLPALFDVIDVQRKLVALRPQPLWLEAISGDIFRGPLVQLLGEGVNEAVSPAVMKRLSEILGPAALQPQEWAELCILLTAPRIDSAARKAGPALISRVERLWIVACGGIETEGHEIWLANMLLELGWRHLHARHVGRAMTFFFQSLARRPGGFSQILRWRLVEWLVRAYVGQNVFRFLREIKRKAVGFFQPSLSG
jgi:hypothetical protein